MASRQYSLCISLRHSHVWAAAMSAALANGGAAAEGDPAATLEPIVVSGKRASLATALQTKRERAEIVDAVAAEDIQKLPDLNVGDALQRITGVQIARDRGESSVAAIRGLGQIETTLNGREVFTAGTGRLLDLADFPAEMLSGIHVYNTSSADQLEGGIGGTVDLRTRRPFDLRETEVGGSARYIQGDLVRQGKGQYSFLASKRWRQESGDEFAIVLPEIRVTADLERVAEKIFDGIASPFRHRDSEIFITVSIGIALSPADADEVGRLLQFADAALGDAKKCGPACYRFYTADLTEKSRERLQIEGGLRHAVVRDELRIHYQPQVDLAAGRLVGAEALMRWHPPPRPGAAESLHPRGRRYRPHPGHGGMGPGHRLRPGRPLEPGAQRSPAGCGQPFQPPVPPRQSGGEHLRHRRTHLLPSLLDRTGNYRKRHSRRLREDS